MEDLAAGKLVEMRHGPPLQRQVPVHVHHRTFVGCRVSQADDVKVQSVVVKI